MYIQSLAKLEIVYAVPRDLGELTDEMKKMLRMLASLTGSREDIILDIRDSREERNASEIAFLTELSDESLRILVHHEPGASRSVCYNQVLDSCPNTQWIQFMDAHVSYDPDALIRALDALETPQSGLLCMVPEQLINGKKQRILMFPERGCQISDYAESRRYWNPIPESFLIKTDLIGSIRFDEKFEWESGFFFMIQILENASSYFITDIPCIVRNYTIIDAESYRPAFAKEWYGPEITGRYMPFLKDAVDSPVRQNGLLYLCERKLYANRNNSNKEVLNDQETDAFFDSLKSFLGVIPDDRIMKSSLDQTSRSYKVFCLFLLRLKYAGAACGKQIEQDGTVYICPREKSRVAAGHLDDIRFQVDAINYQNGKLMIDGELTDIQWAETDEVRVFVRCGENMIPMEYTGIYRFEFVFGRAVWRGYTCRLVLEEEQYRQGSIVFYTSVNGVVWPCSRLLFPRIHSRLSTGSEGRYWRFGNYMITFDETTGANAIRVIPSDLGTRWKMELRFLRRIKSRYYRMIRLLYDLTKPFFHLGGKPIWITYDQLYKGGDNGEYFYRYVSKEHKDDVKMYYLLNEELAKTDPSWRNCGRLIYAHTDSWVQKLKTFLVTLNADMIFSTRASVDSFFDLNDQKARKALGDLYGARVVCIQHGLTVQNIAQYQNRLFDNLQHYFCASPLEKENICRPVYGYTEDMVSITGSPRYDGLVGTPKKQILIAPTWRRHLTDGPNEKGVAYHYVDSFRSSEYFRVYEKLITDKDLIECAERNGYHLIVVLHPNIGSQAQDFTQNEFVNVLNGKEVNYEQIMKTSALMVTDYSGIQYDFAYMRRPVLYYRPESLPPQYDEGFHAEEMRLGPVFTSHDELVKDLCRMMDEGCGIEQAYLDKIDRFFPYADQENCRRMYEVARGL